MKKLCLTLTALTLLLLAAGCAVREEDGEKGKEKDSYIVIHSIESDTDTKITPEDQNYGALLDGLFGAAGEAVGTVTVLSEDAVQTGTVTYYQAPTRTVIGGSGAAYTPILAADLYDDGGEFYAEGYFCADEERALTFCFPVPEELRELVASAGVQEASDRLDVSAQNRPEKMCEDIAAENIRCVSISGSAKSIVIRRSDSENFEFYNRDLNTSHTYTVRCNERGGVLAVEIMMETPEEDNDVLGSPMIDIPQKEFEKIELAGDFRQVSLCTIPSDVWVYGDDSLVNLDLEADRLDHDITLDGSKSNAFRNVSVYFDGFPENIRLELNAAQGGVINDPDSILEEHGSAAGSGEPVVRINQAKEINLYSME